MRKGKGESRDTPKGIIRLLLFLLLWNVVQGIKYKERANCVRTVRQPV